MLSYVDMARVISTSQSPKFPTSRHTVLYLEGGGILSPQQNPDKCPQLHCWCQVPVLQQGNLGPLHEMGKKNK